MKSQTPFVKDRTMYIREETYQRIRKAAYEHEMRLSAVLEAVANGEMTLPKLGTENSYSEKKE